MSSGSLKIIRNFDDPYAHIENAILRDKRMSLAERGFFALVLSLPTNREMTLVYFSRVSGANKETVGKYFHKLEELGYLRRYRERGEHGVFGSTVYEFTTSRASPCTDFPDTVEPDTAEPCTAEPEPVNPSQKNKRKKNNNPPIVPQGDERAENAVCTWKPDRFLAFWEYYRDTFCTKDHSRAGERGEAAIAWDKLKPDDVTLEQIAAKLKAIMKTQQWKDGIGIKMASTFLNGIRLKKIDLNDLPEPSTGGQTPRSAPQVTEEDAPL